MPAIKTALMSAVALVLLPIAFLYCLLELFIALCLMAVALPLHLAICLFETIGKLKEDKTKDEA